MDCSSLAEIKKYIVDNLAGIVSFIMAVLSLIVSWKAYKRDEPNLKLSMYSGEERGGPKLSITKTGLILSIANIGKNPVKLDSLGGNGLHYRKKMIASKILRGLMPKKLEANKFLIDVPEINYYIRPAGVPLTLQPGNRIIFMIDDPKGAQVVKELSKCASSVHIFDAVGNEYRLSDAEFSKLKRMYKTK